MRDAAVMHDHDPANASFGADVTTDLEDLALGSVRDLEAADDAERPRSTRRNALGCAHDIHDRPTLVP